MDEDPFSHLEAVRQWLSDNVVKIDDAAAIAVVDITYDPQTFRGCFVITADGVLLDGEWRFWLGDADGHTHISPPMFISPLGAPASYEAVEISDEQFASVLAQIRAVFPRIAVSVRCDRSTGAGRFRLRSALSVTPWHEFVDTGDAAERVGQPCLRIDAIELRRFDQRIGNCS